MSDPVASELRNLIHQNQELERRLRELQVAIAGIRADFETVMYARIQELDCGDGPHAHVASARQVTA
jgi:hypothetical protein